MDASSRILRIYEKSFSWTELFDDAYLGNVAESKALAAGFGGRVRVGRLSEHAIVTKEMFRDEDDEELWKCTLVSWCFLLRSSALESMMKACHG